MDETGERKLEQRQRESEKIKRFRSNFFSVLWGYFCHYRWILLSYFLCLSIFIGTFFLYRIVQEAVLYAVLLCGLVFLVMLPVHFFRYYFRHRELSELLGREYVSLKQIPQGKNLIEKDYYALLLEWIENTAKQESSFRIFKEESMEYYSTWVHQIKTPIAVMRLRLQEEDTEENQRLLLELSRIEQYVDMVLSYFRLDSDAKDLVIQEYRLDEIIRSCVRKYASWFVMKRIALQYEGTDEMVMTDKKWLCFMIEQILSNAIKYTEEGSVKVIVEPGPVIKIEDTGIGIAKEDIPRIFEKGFTGYNGRADKKSTGIGLYLVKRTVDLLGTPVNVVSTAGKGSCFSIDCSKRHMEFE